MTVEKRTPSPAALARATASLKKALGPAFGPRLEPTIAALGGPKPFIRLSLRFSAPEIIIAYGVMEFADLIEIPLRRPTTKRDSLLFAAIRRAVRTAKERQS